TKEITAPGKHRLSFNFSSGKNALNIAWAALLQDGKEITRDAHAGFTGTSSRSVKANDWNYFLDFPAAKNGARYTVRASVTGDGGNDSSGVVFLGKLRTGND
ncbi:MAG TPA: hypothetical protein VKA67_00155, partial [Verrucomicrobiae bacterium]|nr:hypothetical protein [Verrucomicrobiae bacterium]